MQYSGRNRAVPRYACNRGYLDNGEPKCISFGGGPLDEVVMGQVFNLIQPGAMDAVAHGPDPLERRRAHRGRRPMPPTWPIRCPHPPKPLTPFVNWHISAMTALSPACSIATDCERAAAIDGPRNAWPRYAAIIAYRDTTPIARVPKAGCI